MGQMHQSKPQLQLTEKENKLLGASTYSVDDSSD